jgi:hypothetical protein
MPISSFTTLYTRSFDPRRLSTMSDNRRGSNEPVQNTVTIYTERSQ